jgi:hypothetical protein
LPSVKWIRVLLARKDRADVGPADPRRLPLLCELALGSERGQHFARREEAHARQERRREDLDRATDVRSDRAIVSFAGLRSCGVVPVSPSNRTISGRRLVSHQDAARDRERRHPLTLTERGPFGRT